MWRVARWSPEVAVVALMRCDAGELVDEVSASDADWVDFLGSHPSSDA